MSINDREKAFENKYAHDQEIKFRIEARARKLLGQWAAEKMGLSGTEASAYSATLLDEKMASVSEKVAQDFSDKNMTVSSREIYTLLQEKLAEAEEQIEAEA